MPLSEMIGAFLCLKFNNGIFTKLKKQMPYKDPSNFQALFDFLKGSPSLQGAFMAMVIAALRVIYFGERKPIRIILETLLCGFISLGVSGSIDFIEAIFKIELPHSVLIPACSMVGFIGVTTLREILIKLLIKKTDEKPHSNYGYEDGEDEDNYL